MHRQRGQVPDCETCEYRCPELEPEAEPIWDLWVLCSTQWRASAFNLIGLDYSVVFKMAELYGIELTPVRMNMLRVLESKTLEKARREAKEREASSHGK